MLPSNTGDYILVQVSMGSMHGTMATLTITPAQLYDFNLVKSADFSLILEIEHNGLAGSRHQRYLYDFPYTDKNVAGLVYRALGEFVDVMGVYDA